MALVYRTRPAPVYLTGFYLCMSIGGAIGGLFSGLANGTAYSFRVAAVNAVGDNVASMMVARILGGKNWMTKKDL